MKGFVGQSGSPVGLTEPWVGVGPLAGGAAEAGEIRGRWRRNFHPSGWSSHMAA